MTPDAAGVGLCDQLKGELYAQLHRAWRLHVTPFAKIRAVSLMCARQESLETGKVGQVENIQIYFEPGVAAQSKDASDPQIQVMSRGQRKLSLTPAGKGETTRRRQRVRYRGSIRQLDEGRSELRIGCGNTVEDGAGPPALQKGITRRDDDIPRRVIDARDVGDVIHPLRAGPEDAGLPAL